MNCAEFQRLWNDQLDAREAPSADVALELEQHALCCSVCRSISLKYKRLQQAIQRLGPAPSVPGEAVLRILGQLEQSGRQAIIRSRWSSLPRYAAAALLLITALLALRTAFRSEPVRHEPGRVAAAGRPLSAALADATSATWDLAREASAPAARVGGQVLASAQVPDATGALPLPLQAGATSEVLHEVGDRINAGFEPLTGSARHAFGFLFDPAARNEENATAHRHEGS